MVIDPVMAWWRWWWVVIPVLACAGGNSVCAEVSSTLEESADHWLEERPRVYPRGIDAAVVEDVLFEGLHADFVAGQLKIVWPGNPTDSETEAWLFVSLDEPGHWPARDWNDVLMSSRPGGWEARLPVFDPDIPFVYFVGVRPSGGETTVDGGPTMMIQEGRDVVRCSPLRVCWPRRMGMEEPNRSFFPFLEGFEERVWNWRCFGKSGEQPGWIRSDADAHNGKHALAVTLPAGDNSVRLWTTKVRGWQALRQGAIGIRLWLKAPHGSAQARFFLMAQAGTQDEIIKAHPRSLQLDARWKDVNLRFSDFPEFALVSVDAFVVELTGPDSQIVLVDDLQLLGPWRLLD